MAAAARKKTLKEAMLERRGVVLEEVKTINKVLEALCLEPIPFGECACMRVRTPAKGTLSYSVYQVFDGCTELTVPEVVRLCGMDPADKKARTRVGGVMRHMANTLGCLRKVRYATYRRVEGVKDER